MVQIPVKNVLRNELEHPMIEEFPRHYLGMSMIGEPCDRALQYYHRFASKVTFERRMRRLFDFGHLAEEQIRKEFRRIGVQFHDEQLEIIGFAKHWKGHIDGYATSIPDHPGVWLAEYKTHNEKWFKHLKKNGVKKGFPKQYDQCQRYLNGNKNLQGTFYVGYNKNDSDIYFEFIPHDPGRLKELKAKEIHVVLEDKLFPRIGTGQITWHECQFCDFKKVCFKREPVMKSCRSCKHVECGEEGKWSCVHPDLEWQLDGMKRVERDLEEQKEGCGAYELDVEFFNPT